MFENIRNLGFEKMVVFDTETTGLTPPADCIIELAALCIPLNNGGEPLIVDQMDEFICLEEGRKLAPKIIELTGITDEMLAKEGKPRDEVARRFGDMVRGGPTLLVAHNAQFDGEFTRYLLAGQSFPDGLHWLDSMTVYKDRRSYPHRLESAIRAYGLEGKVQNSHRAIDDTMALYEVLKAMEQERDDLYRYIDLFGYNPKYGAPKHPLAKVKYLPQPGHRYSGIANVRNILPAGIA